jgi:hypothetical protein
MVKKNFIVILLSALACKAQDTSNTGLKIQVYKGMGSSKQKIGYFTPCNCPESPNPANDNPEDITQQFCVACPSTSLGSSQLGSSNAQTPYMSQGQFNAQVEKKCNFPGELVLTSDGDISSDPTEKYFVQFLYIANETDIDEPDASTPYFTLPSTSNDKRSEITYAKDLTLQAGDFIDVVCPEQY